MHFQDVIPWLQRKRSKEFRQTNAYLDYSAAYQPLDQKNDADEIKYESRKVC